MADMIKSVGEGMKDVVQAVSSDALKGVGKVGADVVKGGVETLTGSSVGGNTQQSGGTANETPGGPPSDPVAFEQWKKQKEAPARNRLAQLQSAIKQVSAQNVQKVEEKTAQEQQVKQVEEQKESERVRRNNELLRKASVRGGSGEVKQGKF